jgi:hypothetical protein
VRCEARLGFGVREQDSDAVEDSEAVEDRGPDGPRAIFKFTCGQGSDAMSAKTQTKHHAGHCKTRTEYQARLRLGLRRRDLNVRREPQDSDEDSDADTARLGQDSDAM